jgi:hypothetical protein
MTKATRPQFDAFWWVLKFKDISEIIFWFILVVSLSSIITSESPTRQLLDEKAEQTPIITSILFGTQIVLMMVFAILNMILEYYLIPSAEKIRRNDFIDNSFGSTLNISSSENYFTNNGIEKGIYKASVNLFENCLFSMNISKKMLIYEVIKTSLFVLILIPMAIYGFKNAQISLPLLETFLSVNVIGKLIKLFIYKHNCKACFEKLKEMVEIPDFKKNPNKYIDKFLSCYSAYETNISWGSIVLSGRIYNKLNPKLSKEWEEIKIKKSI